MLLFSTSRKRYSKSYARINASLTIDECYFLSSHDYIRRKQDTSQANKSGLNPETMHKVHLKS